MVGNKNYNHEAQNTLFLLTVISISGFSQEKHSTSPYVLIVQPIVLQSDEGTNPASMALPEELVDKAYEKAGVDFHFLEPLYYNNTKARDGKINLDEIVGEAQKAGMIKGQDDMVNMFFVDEVDGEQGPLGRGMMGGNLTFIALGDTLQNETEKLRNMQAFVIAHEVGHNLSLKHAVDDPNVSDTDPNIQGDGEFKDRIDPENSLNEYQIDIVHKSPLVHSRIDFLSKDIGRKAILDESFEPYFSKLQIREIAAFTQNKVPTSDVAEARNFAREKFAEAVAEFTADEKKCISFVTQKVIETLQVNDVTLMSQHPWRFIKIEDWLCGGFAHTRGTYIILSRKHIDHLCKGWSDQMTPEEEATLVERFGGLLVHEQMHSLQRTFTSKFTKLYSEYWNFKQAHVQDEQAIQVDQVSNPDAPIANWLIQDPKETDAFFWVRTLLKGDSEVPVMGKDFQDTVFYVKKKGASFAVQKDAANNLKSTTLDEIDFFKNPFQ
ncbi:zinc-dependent metalloprotease family protein [Maribacter halichondriae]|uniref:zinc-dependent metalloprotease family protein n=1 Tax=Maribacter halichondriae TaxID=2980554 RepID=UPI00235A0E77|nr:zinc-dependent metalloprotease family protein [Maribacter sp. Hal144]